MNNEPAITPFGNNLLIDPTEAETIYTTEGVKSLFQYGTIKAKGDEVSEKIKVGDVMGYCVWGTRDLEINDKKYYFIPEDSRFLLCKIG